MKNLFLAILVLASMNSMAITKVACHADKAVQVGSSDMKTDTELNFDLERNGNQSVISNIVGHIFVKSPFEEASAEFSTEDSYMGFFKIDSLKANADYHPNKYKGFAQFLKFNAAHTTGVEDGMWGYLALDVATKSEAFKGVYVFQAGDHMGGTVILNCQTR